jgi:hypothetical protein
MMPLARCYVPMQVRFQPNLLARPRKVPFTGLQWYVSGLLRFDFAPQFS